MNPFQNFTKKEYLLWILSAAVVLVSNFMAGKPDPLTLAAALIGCTSLIFAAKGNVWAQFLIIVFSILYGVISYRFCYWGEMVTYLGMTLPMAVWSCYTWLKNPSAENEGEVEIQILSKRKWMLTLLANAAVTVLFYFILAAFDTPNLLFSTLSVSTSFLAASLTMLRSSYYALAYAANDVILIILWILASFTDVSYLPVAVNFVIFLVADLYGFFCWKKRENRQ